jgi:hypothetical protein
LSREQLCARLRRRQAARQTRYSARRRRKRGDSCPLDAPMALCKQLCKPAQTGHSRRLYAKVPKPTQGLAVVWDGDPKAPLFDPALDKESAMAEFHNK